MPQNQAGSAPYAMPPGARPVPHMPGAGRGPSRALPIIVAGGLAVGVFGGLMIVRGTGSSGAATGAPKVDAGSIPVVIRGGPSTGHDAGVAPPKPPPRAPDAAVAVAPMPVDAAPPEIARAVITFDVKPTGAAITVDGEPVEGTTYECELGKDGAKKVDIRASARGYFNKALSHTITGDEVVRIRLGRRRPSSSTGRKQKSSDTFIDID